MKKQIIKCMLIAMTFGMIASMNTMAADENTGTNEGAAASSTIEIDRDANISLTSDEASEGVKAVCLTLDVSPEDNEKNIENVEFVFSEDNDANVTDYRYNAEEGTLNIYMADYNKPLFQGSDTMELGSVQATDEQGEKIEIDVEAPENALSMLMSDGTEKTVAAACENEKKLLGEHFMDVVMNRDVDYTIHIPDSNDKLAVNDVLTVTVDNILLKYNQTLDIFVTSENGWKLKDKNPNNPEEIDYKLGTVNIEDEEDIFTNTTENILQCGNGVPTSTVDLIVLEVDDPQTAGTFEDTLTFSIKPSK